MYLHADDESLGQPTPRIPNPNPQQHCPVLKDAHGRFVDFMNYVQRTADPSDPISKSLVALGEKAFIREVDLNNFIAKCKQAAQPVTVTPPTLQPPQQKQPIPPELMQEIVKMLTGLRWQPKPKPKDPTIPTTLKMRK